MPACWLKSLPVLLLLSGFAAPGLAQSADDEPPPPGMLVGVGDHRLHLDCRGSGTPSVVFDAGLGGNSLDWSLVQPQVAAFTHACAYDRAGYAWSDPGPQPRNAANIVSDLEQLLVNGGVAAPYVLVGHSLGGLIVQQYARQNPHRIAGLVLVDATHEDQFRRLEEAATSHNQARWTFVVVHDAYRAPEGLPDDVRMLAEAFSARAQSLVTIRSELNSLRRSAPLLSTPGMLPDVPLVVISHRISAADASVRDGRWAGIWMEMQRDLATRSSRSKHLIARTGDHYVQVREPEIVIDAVHGIVEEYRAERHRGNDVATGP